MAHNIHCLNCGDCEAAHEDNDCPNWKPDPKEAESRLLEWVDSSPETLWQNKKEIDYLILCCQESEIVDQARTTIQRKLESGKEGALAEEIKAKNRSWMI